MNSFFEKNSKQIFESSTSLSNQAIYWLDKKGKIVFSNACALNMLGYSSLEIKELHIWDIDILYYCKESYESSLNSFVDNKLDDDQNMIFTEHIRKNGLKIPVEVISRFITIDESEYIISYVRDISKRLKRQREIKFYFSLINQSNDMIFLVSKDSMRVEFANERACSSLGYTLEEFKKMSILDFRKPFEGINSDSIPEIFKKMETQNRLITFGKYITKEKLEIPVETSLQYDTYNGDEYVIAISRDISERLEVELKKEELNNKLMNYTNNLKKEVRKSRKELLEYEDIMKRQSKMAAMGEMLENISHQWRQPLSAVSVLSTGMLLQSKNDILTDSLLESGLDDINEHVQYLSRTIDDFRNFFKPDNKKNTFKIKDLVNMLKKLSSAKYDNSSIEFICNIEDVELCTFENELLQVLLNIVSNSKDAFLELDDKLNKLIFIDIIKKDSYLIIKIKDNAKGIPLDIIDNIFKPYFTTKHRNYGTGIGLYMSNKIVSQHLFGTIKASNVSYEYKTKNYKGTLLELKFPI